MTVRQLTLDDWLVGRQPLAVGVRVRGSLWGTVPFRGVIVDGPDPSPTLAGWWLVEIHDPPSERLGLRPGSTERDRIWVPPEAMEVEG